MKGNTIHLFGKHNLTPDMAYDLLGPAIENARASMGGGVLCGLKIMYDGQSAYITWQTPPGDALVTFTT